MSSIDTIGADWVSEQVGNMTDTFENVTPSQFCEEHRYLPESVTSIPGYMRYDVNPYMREIVDCFDINSPVREVALLKGVQITYTVGVLESGILYYAGHVKSAPMMFVTADKEIAALRIENNIIPMLQQSGFGDIIQSSDMGNKRKTGKNANMLQFSGGAYLLPFGANNANKMRSFSIMIMIRDEIDGWPDVVGKDGDPIILTNDRTSGYEGQRKIFDGSTPNMESTSKIWKRYQRGDRRKYMVRCKHCGFPQVIRWSTVDKNTGIIGGFQWDYAEGTKQLIPESVRWCCANCGGEHHEYDKTRLFSPDHGAEWVPTATPVMPNVRSYHLPGLYSPVGMKTWVTCVSDYLECYDPETKRVIDLPKHQTWYNNILAMPYKEYGDKISYRAASAHRRVEYKFGEIPNAYATKNSGSPILFLTCQVDVHKKNLAVAVMGWCMDAKCYLIDYWRLETEGDLAEISDPQWGKLREIIEEKEYVSDNGKKYRITLTFVDAGYNQDTVSSFCSPYESGVYPIVGRDRPSKNQKISEFGEFSTQAGVKGYKIVVDHYKDRLAPVLRREWYEENGIQSRYHFNAPVDITKKQIDELTKEHREQKRDDRGAVIYFWKRMAGADNELWDLLVYGHAAVEVLAYNLCIQYFEMDTIDWPKFWEYIEKETLFIG